MGNRLIEGLKTGQRYIVQVRAKDSAGAFGTYSDVVEITTSTEVAPRAPTSVVLTGTVVKWIGAKYKTTLTLTWVAPAEIIVSKYEAILEEYTGGAWAVADVANAEAYPAKTATEQKWTDYTSSGQYRARIRAISKGNAVGTWSDYATLTPSFTSDLPTPTGLALKQDGKKITASVTAVSQATYPQLSGYRYYASKQTAFTPGATNLIAEPKSNKLTFQEAYDSGDAVIEEIDIADTIYVRVSCFDAAGNESAKCAEVSVLAGGAVPDAPTSVTLTLTPTTIIGRIYNIKAASSWTAPTNVELSGYEQEIYNAANGGGTLQKTLSPGKGFTTSNWTDNDPDTAYSTRIRAVNKWGRIGSWSSWANAAATVDTTAPASPTGVVLNSIMSLFEIKVDKNAEADMHEYIIYVNTADVTPTKGDTEHIIKRMGHPTTRSTLPLGAKTEAATNIITLTTGTTYYFWVSAADVSHNESALVATTPASASVATGLTSDTTPPTVPTNVVLTVTPYGFLKDKGLYRVTWTASTDTGSGMAGYDIEIYDVTNGAIAITRGVLKGYTVITGTGLVLKDGATSYTYRARVRAYDSQDNYSNWSDYTSDIDGVDTTAPATPTGLTLVANAHVITATVILNTERDFGGYEFHFSKVTGFTPDASTLVYNGKASSCQFSTTAHGDVWYCKVKSYDVTGNASAYCSQASVTIAPDADKPSTPGHGGGAIVGTAENELTSYVTAVERFGVQYAMNYYIEVHWDACTSPKGYSPYYRVQHKIQGAADSTYTGGDTRETTYRINGLNPNTTYTIRVKAEDFFFNFSAWSSEINVTTTADTALPPSAFSGRAIGIDGIYLTIDLPVGDETTWARIYVATTPLTKDNYSTSGTPMWYGYGGDIIYKPPSLTSTTYHFFLVTLNAQKTTENAANGLSCNVYWEPTLFTSAISTPNINNVPGAIICQGTGSMPLEGCESADLWTTDAVSDVTITTNIDPTYIRRGNASVKVAVAGSGGLNKYVYIDSIAKLDLYGQFILGDGSYIYTSVEGSGWSATPEIRMHRLPVSDIASGTHELKQIGQVNSMVADAIYHEGYLYILHLCDFALGAVAPQVEKWMLTRIDTNGFERYNTIVLDYTVPSGQTLPCQLVASGRYLYFQSQILLGTGHGHIYCFKIDTATFTLSTVLDVGHVGDADVPDRGRAATIQGTYLYTHDGHTILKKIDLPTFTVSASRTSSIDMLDGFMCSDGTNIYGACHPSYGVHGIFKIPIADFTGGTLSTVNFTANYIHEHSFANPKVNATHLYIGASKSGGDGAICKLTLSDFSTWAQKDFTGDGLEGGIYVDATYVYSVRRSTTDPIKINRVALSDFTTTVTRTFGDRDLSGKQYLTFSVYSPQGIPSSTQWIGAAFGEAAISEQNYTIPDTQIRRGNWIDVAWDISGIAAASRNAVKYFGVKILNTTYAPFTFYIDPAVSYTNIDPAFIDLTGTERILTVKGVNAGNDSSKSATPRAGDNYNATDTGKQYLCFADGTWTQVGGHSMYTRDLVTGTEATNSTWHTLLDTTGVGELLAVSLIADGNDTGRVKVTIDGTEVALTASTNITSTTTLHLHDPDLLTTAPQSLCWPFKTSLKVEMYKSTGAGVTLTGNVRYAME